MGMEDRASRIRVLVPVAARRSPTMLTGVVDGGSLESVVYPTGEIIGPGELGSGSVGTREGLKAM